MPLYEYLCDACGHRCERIQKFSDPIADVCPKCGGAVQKLMSSPAIQFKGSGFYITDYAKKDHVAAAKADSDGSGKAEKTDSGKSEKSEKTEKADTSSKSESSSSSSDTSSSSTTTATSVPAKDSSKPAKS